MIASLVSASLLRGKRWAWRVALIWAAVFGAFGALSLTTMVFQIPGGWGLLKESHPLEFIMGSLSIFCLLTSLAFLSKRESREFFSVEK